MNIFYFHPISFTTTRCGIIGYEAVKDVKAKNRELWGVVWMGIYLKYLA
jgi:hypothetical protein